MLPLTGYPDRRPVIPGANMAANLIGSHGAIAALAALAARAEVGAGQWVDVSGHEVLVLTGGVMLSQIDDLAPRERSGVRALGGAPWGYFSCADRRISLLALLPGHWISLSEWIAEETGNEQALDPKYHGRSAVRARYVDEIEDLVTSLTRRYKADDFCREAQRRGVPAMPVNSVVDLLKDEHLTAIGFWRPTQLHGASHVLWPGPPFRMLGQPEVRPAPHIGADDHLLLEMSERLARTVHDAAD